MRKFGLLFLFSLLMFPVLTEAKTCIDDNRTKCAQLGYTKPVGVCDGRTGIACPYDPTKWFCSEWTCEDGRWFDAMDTTYWTTCNTVWYKNKNCWDCKCAETSPDCAVGDIFFSDGTCSDQYGLCMNKTPVGVVYMLTDAAGNIVDTERSLHGRVINLKDLKTTNKKFDPENPYSGSSNMSWGLYYSNVSTVTNFNSDSALLAAFTDSVGAEGSAEIYNGKGNTVKIDATTPAPVQYWISCSIAPDQEGYYTNQVCGPAAAHNTLLFYPHPDLKTNPKVGAGQWYLPSIGEMAQLYGLDVSAMTSGFGNSGFTGTTFNHINNTLQLLSRKGIDAEPMTSYYWTSTPYDAENTVAMFSNGNRGNDPKNTNDKVRASLQF